MKTLILSLVILVAMAANAGHEVGNGGTIIKCQDGHAELTDLFEARVFRGLQSALGDPAEDYKIKVERVFSALSRVAPFRTQKYRQLYSGFFNDAVFVTGVNLTPIDDVDPKGLPAGCALQQAVIQTVPEFVGDKRYAIDQDKWNYLDENSKAALVIHEIIYNEAMAYGAVKSTTTRYITGLVTSTSLLSVSQDKFNEMLLSAKFSALDQFNSFISVSKLNDTITYYSGKYNSFYDSVQLPQETEILGVNVGPEFEVVLQPDKEVFYDVRGLNLTGLKMNLLKGNVSHDTSNYVILAKQGDIALQGKSVLSLGTVEQNVTVGITAGDVEITFGNELNDTVVSSTTTAIMRFDERNKPTFSSGVVQVKIPKMGFESPVLYGHVNFYRSGVPLVGTLTEDVVKLNSPQGAFYFTHRGYESYGWETHFFENGSVRESNILPGQKIRTAAGDVITKENNRVRFLENGLAKITDTNPTPPPQ